MAGTSPAMTRSALADAPHEGESVTDRIGVRVADLAVTEHIGLVGFLVFPPGGVMKALPSAPFAGGRLVTVSSEEQAAVDLDAVDPRIPEGPALHALDQLVCTRRFPDRGAVAGRKRGRSGAR